MKPVPKLILASSSHYRKQQLKSLGLEFSTQSPDVNEARLNNEEPLDLVTRLAHEKALKVQSTHPNSCVIAGDQICTFEGHIYGKPGTFDRAVQQLQTFSNNCVEFFTALSVLSPGGGDQSYVDTTVVTFRVLSNEEIRRYVEIEQPLDCAGAFKVESLGLSLFKSVKSEDPSALIGMPLIKLGELLRKVGYQIP